MTSFVILRVLRGEGRQIEDYLRLVSWVRFPGLGEANLNRIGL